MNLQSCLASFCSTNDYFFYAKYKLAIFLLSLLILSRYVIQILEFTLLLFYQRQLTTVRCYPDSLKFAFLNVATRASSTWCWRSGVLQLSDIILGHMDFPSLLVWSVDLGYGVWLPSILLLVIITSGQIFLETWFDLFNLDWDTFYWI